MSILHDERLNLCLLEDTLWMLTKPIGKANYDFAFEQLFHCTHKYQLPTPLTAIACVGARDDYTAFYNALQQAGISLIHSPSDHAKASELPHWYPLITDLTPRSRWFSSIPTLERVLTEFDFPFFSKAHAKRASIKKVCLSSKMRMRLLILFSNIKTTPFCIGKMSSFVNICHCDP
ncbi:MAG: hypothetical protein AAFQ07_04675 [Chloroflexota bacterium]